MALLGFMIPLLGIEQSHYCDGYSLFIVTNYKNSCRFDSINEERLLRQLNGIGLTRLQVLYKVQIPLAAPVIMAGVRISM